MGRLTEAFGFLNVSVKKYNKIWLMHNVTSLSPSHKLYSIRKEVLKAKKEELNEQENEDNQNNEGK